MAVVLPTPSGIVSHSSSHAANGGVDASDVHSGRAMADTVDGVRAVFHTRTLATDVSVLGVVNANAPSWPTVTG